MLSLAGAALAALALPLNGPLPAAPPDLGAMALRWDASDRLTIPVTLNGQGPFPFVIDTGADRTVISAELARSLNLPPGPEVSITNSGGVDTAPTAVIAALEVGGRSGGPVEAPILSAVNLGALGMLGVDILKDRRIVLDFNRRRLTSTQSQGAPTEAGTIVVRGKSRFGQLILMDATVRGAKVLVILDSGAQTSVGNLALETVLRAAQGGEDPRRAKVVSVTGRTTPASFRDIADARVGALVIHNMALAFADLHTFHRFGLVDQPAMLLGMDVLKLCAKVTVDFKRREASFILN